MLMGSPSGTALLTMLDTRTGSARAAMIETRRVSPGSEPFAAPGGAVIMLDEPPRYPLAFVDEVTGEGTVIVDPPRGRMATRAAWLHFGLQPLRAPANMDLLGQTDGEP